MIIVTLQRQKCIGCNYCVEMDPIHFQMSKKDGKSVLLESVDKKGFHTVKIATSDIFESLILASNACPVRIITVKNI